MRWVGVALVLVAALLYACMAVRRRLFARGGGAVECSLRELRPEGGAPGAWRLGIGDPTSGGCP